MNRGQGMGVKWLALVSVWELSACSPIPTPQGANGSTEQAATAPSDASGAALDEAAPQAEGAQTSDLELAKEVAEKTAELYDSSKAAAEDVILRLRVRVDGKPASLAAERERIEVLTGAVGAGAADMTVDLSRSQAEAIVSGQTTLRSLVQNGEAKTDNEQGLARFLEFITR